LHVIDPEHRRYDHAVPGQHERDFQRGPNAHHEQRPADRRRQREQRRRHEQWHRESERKQLWRDIEQLRRDIEQFRFERRYGEQLR
jgi:hypothetical protein